MDFEVSGQFESSLPSVSVDVHPDGSVVVLVLGVDLLGFVVLVEEKGQRSVSDDFRRTVAQLADENHLFWDLDSCEGSFCALQLLVLEGGSSKASPKEWFLHESAKFGGLFPLAFLAEIKKNGWIR